MIKKTLLAIASVAFMSAALAQSHVSEAKPQTDTKPQLAAEAKKNARPEGTAKIMDGSTARGEGSGIRKPSAPELKAAQQKAAREAQPHRDPMQGGTPPN